MHKLFLSLLLLLCCLPGIIAINDNADELPAGGSNEDPRVTMWRGHVEAEAHSVDIAQAAVDSLVPTLDAATGATQARISASLDSARSRLSSAQDRLLQARVRLSDVMSDILREQRQPSEINDNGKRAASEDKATDSSGSAASKLLKRTLPQPHDGWRDKNGKLHRRHQATHSFLSLLFWIFWAILDSNWEENGLSSTPSVRLADPVSLEDLQSCDTPIELHELASIALREIYEFSHELYLRQTKGITIADFFSGDDVFGADRKVAIQDRFLAAQKRAGKEAAAAPKSSGNFKRRKTYPAPRQPPPAPAMAPPMAPPGAGLIGPCHKCNQFGHLARQCPNNRAPQQGGGNR